MAVIEVCNLTKRFGDVPAVDHVTFTVEQGSVVGFLGPNGAGKTTTLRMLVGLVTPTEGTATINGHPYAQLPAPSQAVGAVFESSNVHPGRSARNHLRVRALATGVPVARVEEMLDLVGLTGAANRRIGGFSLGMRQRLGLANALLSDPEILILDEPANGLDPEGVHWLRRLIRDLAHEGRTVVVSSHLLSEVAQIADTVVIMDRGRLITHTTLAELTTKAGQTIRVRTPRPDQLAKTLQAHGAGVQIVSPDRLEITAATSEKVGTLAAEAQIPIFETATETHDLEDVFLRLTAETTRPEVIR